MPWYTNPVTTRKVLTKITKRYDHTKLHELKSVLDDAAEIIWQKQAHYYEGGQQPNRSSISTLI
jgi:hypothetical protein